MTHRWPWLAAALLAWAASGAAQDLRVVGFSGVSNQELLERTLGVGVFLAVAPLDWMDVSIGLAWSGNESEREGLACVRFRPFATDCVEGRLEETVTIRSFRVAAHPYLALHESLRARGGVGISSNQLRAASVSPGTQRVGNLYVPPSAHMGGFVHAGLAWTPLYRLPLNLLVGATGHWIRFEGCRDHAAFYAPFCGVERITELTVGASLRVFR
jgi:hypothetical protein